MRKINRLPQYEKDYKRILRSHAKRKDIIANIKEVKNCLINKKPLPRKYNDHALKRNWKDFRECHLLGNNILLVYKISYTTNTVNFVRIGSHSEIFGSKKKPKFRIPESFLSMLLRNLK